MARSPLALKRLVVNNSKHSTLELLLFLGLRLAPRRKLHSWTPSRVQHLLARDLLNQMR